ncbi:hypothetical protein [Halomonas flagellata]|nr:hypothetical protein [Halomonas flagellata]
MELVCPAGNLPALKRAVDQAAESWDGYWHGRPGMDHSRAGNVI